MSLDSLGLSTHPIEYMKKPADLAPTSSTVLEDGSVAVSLDFCPVVVNLRRPKGKDLKAIEDHAIAKPSAGSVDTMFFVIGLLSGMAASELEEMDAEDIQKLSEAVEANFRVFRKPQ